MRTSASTSTRTWTTACCRSTGRREVNDEFRKTVAGTGSYDTIVPKFKALVDERDPNLDYYARGTFTSHNLDFAEDVLSIADAGFDRLSVEPVTADPGCGYDLTEDDLPKIEPSTTV